MASVLFWDIDGTLLTTERAGMLAWNDAVREVTGREFDLRTGIRTSGFTDYQIAVRTFEVLGLQPATGEIDRLVRRYEERLPASLPLRNGRVLDNVREILEALAGERPDVRSYLLTGNTPGGARAKLTHFGLVDLLSEGAFSVDTRPRADIARRALDLARRAGPVAEDQVVVIGDTPHDIECAAAIGARTLAVATGGYSLDELQRHRPWRLFASLPSPDEFIALIDTLAPAAAPAGQGA
ncbi:MAG: HAD family hydrolase [Acidimicrobiia bacterium]|nr:HAD family hydrolase [Acidimicrobiia bacterium]